MQRKRRPAIFFPRAFKVFDISLSQSDLEGQKTACIAIFQEDNTTTRDFFPPRDVASTCLDNTSKKPVKERQSDNTNRKVQRLTAGLVFYKANRTTITLQSDSKTTIIDVPQYDNGTTKYT